MWRRNRGTSTVSLTLAPNRLRLSTFSQPLSKTVKSRIAHKRLILRHRSTSTEEATNATTPVAQSRNRKQDFVVAVGLGGASGAATVCAGIGASIFMNPGLTGLLGLSQLEANATTMVTLTVSALCGSGNYLTAGIVNVPVALCLSIPSVIFASVSARYASRFSPRTLQLAFCALLAGVLPMAIVKDYNATIGKKEEDTPSLLPKTPTQQPQQAQPQQLSTVVNKWPSSLEEWKLLWDDSARDIPSAELARHCAVGVGIGVLTGIMGIGGAFLVAAYLSVFCGLTQQEAVATAVFGILPPGIVSAIIHLRLGNVRTALLPPLLLGTVIGAVSGSHFAMFIPEDILRHIFTFALTLVVATSMRTAFRKIRK